MKRDTCVSPFVNGGVLQGVVYRRAGSKRKRPVRQDGFAKRLRDDIRAQPPHPTIHVLAYNVDLFAALLFQRLRIVEIQPAQNDQIN